MKENNEDKFSVFIPFEIEKATDLSVDKYQNMRIRGIASSTKHGEDADGETLEPSGMDVSDLLSRGTLNFHHLWTKDPLAIIGEPVKAEIRNDELYIEGKLYPSSQKARDVYDLGEILEKDSKTRRLGFSIEGKALVRDPKNKNRILKSRLSAIAITPSPKCKGTRMDIMKGGLSDIEYELEKADSEYLVDITDSNGTRRTVDKNLSIKVWNEDLEKGGKGSGRHSDLLHPLTHEKLKNFSSMYWDNYQKYRREGLNHGGASEKAIKHFKENSSHYNPDLDKAMTAGTTTGRDTTNQILSQEPLKQESIEGKKKKKKKNELSKAEIFLSLTREGYDEESCRQILLLADAVEKGGFGELEKGGEGSKGGKVIGHTKSGKPIYDRKVVRLYHNYSKKDHEDAKEFHKQRDEYVDADYHEWHRNLAANREIADAKTKNNEGTNKLLIATHNRGKE